jgi:hypothetical protein
MKSDRGTLREGARRDLRIPKPQRSLNAPGGFVNEECGVPAFHFLPGNPRFVRACRQKYSTLPEADLLRDASIQQVAVDGPKATQMHQLMRASILTPLSGLLKLSQPI